MSSVSPIQIPSRLPLLLTHEGVLLPGSTMRTSVDSARNLQLVRSRLLKGTSLQSTILGVIPNTPDPASDAQDLPPLHRIGTAALAVQVVGSNWPKPHYTLLITGLCRFQIVQVLKEKPYPIAEVEQLDRLEEFPNTCKMREELGELSEQFYKYAVQLVEMLDMSVPAVAKLRRLLDSLPREALPDILTSIIRTSNKEKLQILDAVSLEERFKMTIPLLVRQIEGLKLLQKTRKPKQDDDKRVIAIRPIRRITHISGTLEDEDEDEDNDDIVMLEKKIRTSSMPEQAHKVCVKEIKRLKKMPQSMPEYALTRNYLELMVELPWNKSTTDRLDIRAARILLDNDHYAMEKLKKRVLEYLAVRQLKNNLKGPILCFVGPPGVGKTSVGRSVAKTLGREFHRIALGGVCDQSDIRGHRRTYVGSMPGRIINGLKTVGVNNPVFLLDEVDKLGKSLQGDPAAALLEVLDPEQNHNFTDHYLNVAFDLSQVLFIATANTTATIPAALLDRMEIIQVPGYTQEEKIEIAHRHLIPKQLEQHGLTPQQIQIPQVTTLDIITRYTREAGVRSLDRKLGAICRAVAVKVAEGQHKEAKLDRSDVTEREGCREHILEDEKPESISDTTDLALPPEMPILIDFHALKDILGPPMYEMEVSQRLSQPGVAIGLAWTPLGGEIMFVEASRMDGEGQLTLTGQLGDVMKESAHLAISWLRSNAKKYQLTNAFGSFDLLDNTDIHLHFPAGAVTKDGPSAGVTIVTCLASLFSGRLVRSDVAMTGEITLRGLVLPVGGIKDKVLAAHRAGLKQVIIPRRNEKDLEGIPGNVRQDLSFVTASCLDEVLNAAFDGGFTVKTRPGLLNSKL
ncbi:lon peptidase 2, peroxisomal [Homo sapiens]|uniref:Lon protease homolog 2, peroxisomal n=2 Tax=Homo sapiens TaxID=9606 RepID=LONP2_HUMAN|nr:lon protease homolog 2, peroxisomal isoform 1 [Homo sapiens]Q86WA8.1 RecName: Full=Lon protease homolog 2, peroxisomal; AltName: Full=Lon protease-like protein 2; Short=Lon protease 2; AltName: Full=Peroxisomal Lon protease; Short=pLon [Homo sapiens]AAH93910.1 Lon peptidase 2, peroxisomal [Homo sapiens]AAH93912.1 Lon peptidase 2, peroxisomal [Homo sapiens]EAW82724.1 peroxisomal LON protease like, isoform CRA_b [Homo sapiens]KAI2578407.1 lon peptidase 2, peroxisomal [Homo sapiens]KAI4054793|eukprot:NP_113678.2 lon protease homolog 2, peroxisomal isoform 1 [Homo sapiens]